MKNRIKKSYNSLFRKEGKALILFPITVLFIAPIIHELGHITFLLLYNCPFHFDFGALVGGEFLFRIQPLCELGVRQAVTILSAGLIFEAIAGVSLFLIAAYKRMRADSERKILSSFLISVISLGFFFSISFYIIQGDGDIAAIMEILEIHFPHYYMIGIGLIILSFTLIRFWLEFRAIKKKYMLTSLIDPLKRMAEDNEEKKN